MLFFFPDENHVPRKSYRHAYLSGKERFVTDVRLRPVASGQSLQEKCHDVADEWDDKLNAPVTPDMVAFASNLHAWWLCKREQHSFPARINARTKTLKPTGCPYCNGRLPIPGKTDFKSQNQFWADHWDYAVNPDNPEDLTWCSGQKRNFICPKCHQSFPMQISKINRKTKKTHCPFCNHQIFRKGVNDLATEHPELVEYWDKDRNGGLDPSDVMAAGTKKYWWKCENGHPHSYETLIPTRAKCGCPYCANRLLLSGFNDLAKRYPSIVPEWDTEKNAPVTPSDIMPGNQYKFWWNCPSCGKSYQMSPDNRVRGHACRECWNRYGTSWPEQMIYYYIRKFCPDAQIHYLDGFELDIFVPSRQTGIEYDGMHHKNKQQQDQEKSDLCRAKGIKLIRVREKGLPDISGCTVYVCSQKAKYDELKEIIKKILCQEFGVQPEQAVIDPKEDFNKIYSSYRLNLKKDSLEARYPELVKKQWDYEQNGSLNPSQVAPGCNQHKVWWHCSKGHVFHKEPLPMVKSFRNHTDTEGCEKCWKLFLRKAGPYSKGGR